MANTTSTIALARFEDDAPAGRLMNQRSLPDAWVLGSHGIHRTMRARRSRTTQQDASAAARPSLARPLWIGLALALITCAVFAPVRHFGLVNWDDPQYISANPHVLGGL